MMSNFSTKIGPGSPLSPFTWIPQLLVFLNLLRRTLELDTSIADMVWGF